MNIKRSLIIIVTFSLLISQSTVQGQSSKKQLDTVAFNNWPVILDEAWISNDGKFAAYIIEPGHDSKRRITVFHSLTSNWQQRFGNVSGAPKFTKDSRFVFFSTKDGFWRLELGTSNTTLIAKDITDYQLVNNEKREFLLFSTRNGSLNCQDVISKKTKTFSAINLHEVNLKNGLIYLSFAENDQEVFVRYTPAKNLQEKLFSSKAGFDQMIIDESGKQLVLNQKDGKIFLFEGNGDCAREIVLKLQGQEFDKLSFRGISGFAAGGKKLIIKLVGPKQPIQQTFVKVFSYQDPFYFTTSSAREPIQSEYSAILDLTTSKVIRLEYPGDKIADIPRTGFYTIVTHLLGDSYEYYWNKLGQNQVYIIDLVTGERKQIGQDIFKQGAHYLKTIQGGRYILFYNIQNSDTYIYNTQNGKLRNITQGLPVPTYDSAEEEPQHRNLRSIYLCGTSTDEKFLLFTDRYDIWEIDPDMIREPLNLTGSVGRKTEIVFRFSGSQESFNASWNDEVILSAFNEQTKDNGFYRLSIGKPGSLTKINMAKCMYYAPGQRFPGTTPVKAKNVDVWLVRKQSAEESPNWYWTTDFANFKPVSNNYPESDYTWFTTELFDYVTKSGVNSKAILYKPKDFDPKKKYPVLFNYYQTEQTDKLNMYLSPARSEAYEFNYPLMLSKGYLICLTDVHQKVIGETANCVVDAVEGAADELAKRPYVDSLHLGACGGSFAGYVTNCLAAFSKKFAALVPISAPSDIVSFYSAVPGIGVEITENRQIGMGVSLAADPERYLRNSPLAYAKNVTTPVLIVSTLQDYNVNAQQGIEWYISLRREGKPAWLLQYQQNGHGIGGAKSQADLGRRMEQFFDHFLKGMPAPHWMTRVLYGDERDPEDPFGFDLEIDTPQPSQLISPKKN